MLNVPENIKATQSRGHSNPLAHSVSIDHQLAPCGHTTSAELRSDNRLIYCLALYLKKEKLLGLGIWLSGRMHAYHAENTLPKNLWKEAQSPGLPVVAQDGTRRDKHYNVIYKLIQSRYKILFIIKIQRKLSGIQGVWLSDVL